MPSFLDPLRMKTLFGGENTFGPPPMVGNDLPQNGGIMGNMPPPINPFGAANPMGQPGMEAPDEYNVSDRMKALYTPETEASDRLNALISAYPQREKAGMLKKIATMIVGGVSGSQNALNMFDRPHQTQVEDWKNKVGPTTRAAELERSNNVNERTLAYNTVAQELRAQSQAATERKDEARAKIAQQRADVYEFKAKNPLMKFLFPKGGNIIAIDPQTGKQQDTGIPTGSMTDLDKLHLGHEFRTEENEQKGDITSRQIGERGAESRATAVVRGEESRKTKSVPSAKTTTGGKDELPTQTRVRQFNAARELWNTRPELRPFIKVGNPASNDFSVTPPGTNLFKRPTGPSKAQYDEIQEAIYGPKMQRASNKPEKMTKTQRNSKTGATRQVESTDGGKTWQPVKK